VITVVQLVAQAVAAGLTLDADDRGALVIRGPATAGPLAEALVTREAAVGRTLDVVNGRAPVLDWKDARSAPRRSRCVLCGNPAALLCPYEPTPTAMHKTCAEAFLLRARRKGRSA